MQFLAGRIFSSAAIACRQSVLQHAETASRASAHVGAAAMPSPGKHGSAPVRGRQGGQSRPADPFSTLAVPGECAGEQVPFHRLRWLCIL